MHRKTGTRDSRSERTSKNKRSGEIEIIPDSERPETDNSQLYILQQLQRDILLHDTHQHLPQPQDQECIGSD